MPPIPAVRLVDDDPATRAPVWCSGSTCTGSTTATGTATYEAELLAA
ncbi:hypothetical protein [Hymenobacter daecheongensis]|nr:hypothetical protein [Hymenobacter daecheongensis]